MTFFSEIFDFIGELITNLLKAVTAISKKAAAITVGIFQKNNKDDINS